MTSPTPAPREPARLLLPSDRSDVRVTWHADRDVFTVTLWRGGTCIASAPITPADAAALAAFVVGHLGRRPGSATTPPNETGWRRRLRAAISALQPDARVE